MTGSKIVARVKVERALWLKMRLQALERDVPLEHLVDEAFRGYLSEQALTSKRARSIKDRPARQGGSTAG